MSVPLYFDQLAVGNQWETRGRTVTETDIVQFACTTGDFDPLHVDHEQAKQTPFRRPIAHGLLGVTWVAGLASHYPLVHTVAFLGIHDWEFLKPIFVGDTLRVINSIQDLRLEGRRRGHVVWNRQLMNQDNMVVQRGLFETLVAVSPNVVATPRKLETVSRNFLGRHGLASE
ncbi:MAG: MaoC/PaaZ C-terminal domain-containing protein [Pirellulales bacterium]